MPHFRHSLSAFNLPARGVEADASPPAVRGLMAYNGRTRKRRRQQPQQQQQTRQLSEAALPTESVNESQQAVARGKDAATQTSPPRSPSTADDDSADLSSLLLQPHSSPQQPIDSPGAWLAWLQLSGFTQSAVPAATTSSTTTAATVPGAASAASPQPPSSSSAAFSTSSLSSSAPSSMLPSAAAATYVSSSTPMSRRHASQLPHPSTSPPPLFGSAATSTIEHGQTRPTVDGRAGRLASALPAAAPSTSMLHLRPSSAVVLPIDTFRPPLVDTHTLPSHPSRSEASRPALLPWMQKQAAVSPLHRHRIG